MTDLQTAGNSGLENVTASTLILFFRDNPQAITPELQKVMAQYAVIQDGANRAIKDADRAELKKHYTDWKELFLSSRKSGQTRRAYTAAIGRYESFCQQEGIEPTALKYADAVKFTQSHALTLKDGGGIRAPESVRRDIAAVSAFYTELYKLSESQIINPFIRLGTKPEKQTTHIKDVPSKKEVDLILASTSGIVHAAICTMALRGLRIGALKKLHLTTRDGRTTFETVTKGKAQNGVLPADTVNAITADGLPKIEPFAGIDTPALAMRIERELNRLADAGLLPSYTVTKTVNGKPKSCICCRYSCHSFRHYFAVTEYGADHDIERLRKLLNHADINTTQIYLQSLGMIE
jgi:site-specific recombinase XerD